ncbi:hypothetical protein GCM10023215_31520 [Pseudonocardia yuanmonensis]|uniref:Uncharacterized protein n=1 Tax=Pseudonocardia yuanmonensis TaxID=1095914 RepID=A0ABP8WNJ4_9PSEU
MRFGWASTPGFFGQVGCKVENDALRRGPWLILGPVVDDHRSLDVQACNPADTVLSVRLVHR